MVSNPAHRHNSTDMNGDVDGDWTTHECKDTGHRYRTHSTTGESVWEGAEEASPNVWTSHVTEEGACYRTHSITGETEWQLEQTSAGGDVASGDYTSHRCESTGHFYSVNTKTGESEWELHDEHAAEQPLSSSTGESIWSTLNGAAVGSVDADGDVAGDEYTSHRCESTGHFYSVNHKTGESKWEMYDELAVVGDITHTTVATTDGVNAGDSATSGDFTSHRCESTGHRYKINMQTGESAWEVHDEPAALGDSTAVANTSMDAAAVVVTGDDAGMWAMAVERFAALPHSNGRDKRYETVKAEIRARYGKVAIKSADTKARLKNIAKARGVDKDAADTDADNEAAALSLQGARTRLRHIMTEGAESAASGAESAATERYA